MDEETGLYYYGARYYDPVTSVWQSVDPSADEYIGLSPYVFSADNPMLFVDFDGRDIVVALGGWAQFQNNASPVAQSIANTINKEASSAGLEDVNAKAFPSDSWDNVKSNIMTYIKDNYSEGEKIILYGYSWGGETMIEMAEDLRDEGYTVDLLLTVDPAKGPFNFSSQRQISDNVDRNINFYQTTHSGIGSRGGPNYAADPSKTAVKNIRRDRYFGKKVGHGNIDEATKSDALNFMRRTMGLPLKGKSPKEERKQMPKFRDRWYDFKYDD